MRPSTITRTTNSSLPRRTRSPTTGTPGSFLMINASSRQGGHFRRQGQAVLRGDIRHDRFAVQDEIAVEPTLGRQDEHDGLFQVAVDGAAFLDCMRDRGEVVVGQHHLRRLLGRLGAFPAHRHADVGTPQRGRSPARMTMACGDSMSRMASSACSARPSWTKPITAFCASASAVRRGSASDVSGWVGIQPGSG